MDLHCCGECKQEFDSYGGFLIHKLLVEQYKLTLEPSEHIPGLRLPKLVKPQSKSKANGKHLTSNTAVPLTIDIDSQSPTLSVETTPRSPDQCTMVTRVSPSTEEGVDIDSDDSISISSQTESLKIDESAKDIQLSPFRDGMSLGDSKQKSVCKSCGKYYKNNVILRVHQETVHSITRPFTCEHCQLAFKSKGSLVRHIRIHTGERPFKCKECNKAFHDSGTLSRHMHKLHSALGTTRPNELQVLITRIFSEDELLKNSPIISSR